MAGRAAEKDCLEVLVEVRVLPVGYSLLPRAKECTDHVQEGKEEPDLAVKEPGEGGKRGSHRISENCMPR